MSLPDEVVVGLGLASGASHGNIADLPAAAGVASPDKAVRGLIPVVEHDSLPLLQEATTDPERDGAERTLSLKTVQR